MGTESWEMTVADGLYQSAAIRDESLGMNGWILYFGSLQDSYSQRLQKRLFCPTSPEGNIKSVTFNHLLAWTIMPLGWTSLDTNVNNQDALQVDDNSD